MADEWRSQQILGAAVVAAYNPIAGVALDL